MSADRVSGGQSAMPLPADRHGSGHFTLAEQLAEVEREIALRRRVYPSWINAGRLTAARAEQQIAAMEAVRLTLMELLG